VFCCGRGDALGDDGAAGVAADVDHLGAGVGLLAVVGQGHGVELAHELSPLRMQLGYFQVIAEPVSTWVQEMRELAPAHAALGHEVVDAALAFLVAGVPVLHRGILDRALSCATSSTTAACSWFSSRIGAVQPSR
jgi:hypothetical protein